MVVPSSLRIRTIVRQFAKLVLDHSTPLETNNHTMYINVLPAYDKDAHIEQTGQYEELLKQRPGHLHCVSADFRENTLQTWRA
eukprot:6465199-Amphidinium_carterae.2